ncbi:MAG TPA: hypothetical protein VFS99_08745 [Xanthomonadaceae bacterium]|nr:hypothetical protein [Xanthomonadaceae bacterium]
MRQWAAIATLFFAWAAVLPAAEPESTPEPAREAAPADAPDARRVMNSAGFLLAHPDLRWRREGIAALGDGRAGEALTYFQRAARYADKASQAMVAEMLWTGTGVPVDRPRAYAWMDIAAERAYIPFVAKREQYWNALSAAERTRALEVGRRLYEEHRDDVAKERLERELAKAKRKITGSRVGNVGNLQVMIPLAGGKVFTTISGERYYDDTYWEPDQYWAWQDSIWKDPPIGTVNVKPLEVVRPGDD